MDECYFSCIELFFGILRKLKIHWINFPCNIHSLFRACNKILISFYLPGKHILVFVDNCMLACAMLAANMVLKSEILSFLFFICHLF